MYNPDKGVYVFYVGVERQVETSRLLKTLGVPYQVRLDFREKECSSRAYSRVATGDSFNVIDDKCRIRPIEVELDRTWAVITERAPDTPSTMPSPCIGTIRRFIWRGTAR